MAMRMTDLWWRLEQTFGEAYVASVAHDHVLAELGGRTINQALADGVEAVEVWRGVVAAYPDRVPAQVR
jgi:Protein of unknown function (DUF3046)